MFDAGTIYSLALLSRIFKWYSLTHRRPAVCLRWTFFCSELTDWLSDWQIYMGSWGYSSLPLANYNCQLHYFHVWLLAIIVIVQLYTVTVDFNSLVDCNEITTLYIAAYQYWCYKGVSSVPWLRKLCDIKELESNSLVTSMVILFISRQWYDCYDGSPNPTVDGVFPTHGLCCNSCQYE